MALRFTETKQHHTGLWIFLVIVLLLMGAFGWYGYRWYTTGEMPAIALPMAHAASGISVDESNVTPQQVTSYTVAADYPRYISIPSLGVPSTRVFPVGLTSSNVLEQPTNINDAAWYNKSATPGSGGVILIDAHSTGAANNGIFTKLNTLKLGDVINLVRGDEQRSTYSVRENKILTLDEVNALGSNTMGQPVIQGKEGLNLTTYAGKYIPRLGAYDHRVILRASLVE